MGGITRSTDNALSTHVSGNGRCTFLEAGKGLRKSRMPRKHIGLTLLGDRQARR